MPNSVHCLVSLLPEHLNTFLPTDLCPVADQSISHLFGLVVILAIFLKCQSETRNFIIIVISLVMMNKCIKPLEGIPYSGWGIQSYSWVCFYLSCYTLCLVLLGLMGNWQNWLGRWAGWWSIIDQSQPNPTIWVDAPPCTRAQIAPGPSPFCANVIQRGVNLSELFAKHQPAVAGCGWLQPGKENFSQLSSNKFTPLCIWKPTYLYATSIHSMASAYSFCESDLTLRWRPSLILSSARNISWKWSKRSLKLGNVWVLTADLKAKEDWKSAVQNSKHCLTWDYSLLLKNLIVRIGIVRIVWIRKLVRSDRF